MTPSMWSILRWMTYSVKAYPPRRLQRMPPRHPRCVIQILPPRPRPLMALQCLHRPMWSRTRPHQVMGEWTRVPLRICLAPMPQIDTWSLVTHITRTDPICPENVTSGIREVLHPSNGAHSWTLAARLMQMARTCKRRAILTVIKACHVLLRTRTMGPVTPGMNRRALIRGDTPLTSPPYPSAPGGGCGLQLGR